MTTASCRYSSWSNYARANCLLQFRYGEDGLDVGRATFLHPNQYKFLEQNLEATRSSLVPSHVRDVDWGFMKTEKHFRGIQKWRRRHGTNVTKFYEKPFVEFSSERLATPKQELVEAWRSMSKEERDEFGTEETSRCPVSTDVVCASTAVRMTVA